MGDPDRICEEFRELVEKHVAFLQDYGFRRSPSHEVASSTGCSIVYLGDHVGIVIAFDIRDKHVDMQVARVNNGVLRRNWEGGYSSGLFRHLVKHAGYRGRQPAPVEHKRSPTSQASIEQMIEAWVDLLISAGETILKDELDSLPS